MLAGINILRPTQTETVRQGLNGTLKIYSSRDIFMPMNNNCITLIITLEGIGEK